MMTAVLSCSACEAVFPPQIVEREVAACPNCHRAVRVVAFPALLGEPPAGTFGERLSAEGESSCFYHSDKKANVVCDGCGRFLCGLCAIEMGDEYLCSRCLEAGRGKSGEKTETERILYEQIALAAAGLGVLIGPFGVLPSLFAIYLSIRYWRKPEKLGAWRRVRKVVAISLASVVVVVWVSTFIWIIS